jgi:hypothetical protein
VGRWHRREDKEVRSLILRSSQARLSEHGYDAVPVDGRQATWATEAVARAVLALEQEWPDFILVREAKSPTETEGAWASSEREHPITRNVPTASTRRKGSATLQARDPDEIAR